MSDLSERRGPSRKECEDIIRRILMTEVLEKGTNEHFKTAADFMGYFQSLYPAGDALVKQVQRAVKSMNLPKDEHGYFIINKTAEQLDQDKELRLLLEKTNASVTNLGEHELLFLEADSQYKDYLYQLLFESVTCREKYITMINSSDGIIFLTKNAAQLEVLLNSLINS